MGSVYPSILEGSSSIHGAREGKIRHDQPRVHGQTGRAAPCRILVDRTDPPHQPPSPTPPPPPHPPQPPPPKQPPPTQQLQLTHPPATSHIPLHQPPPPPTNLIQ